MIEIKDDFTKLRYKKKMKLFKALPSEMKPANESSLFISKPAESWGSPTRASAVRALFVTIMISLCARSYCRAPDWC